MRQILTLDATKMLYLDIYFRLYWLFCL